MGLTNAQNADFNRKLLRASQGIKGAKSAEELKQMSSTELREMFDKKIASYEKAIEKAKNNKSISPEEIERKQAGVGKYKEVFDSVVNYQEMREVNAKKLETQAEIKQTVKEVIGAGFDGMAKTANVISDVAHIMLGLDKKEKNTKPSEEKVTTIDIETVTETVKPKEEQKPASIGALNTEPTPIKLTESERRHVEESAVKETSDTSAKQTEKSSNKNVGKTIGNVAKTVGVMTLASLVIPPPVVLATVGGVMTYKGGKKAVHKVKEGLADNPRAKAIAKNTAALLVGGPIGLGAYSIGKAISKGVKKKRLKNEIDSLKREDTDIKDDQKKMQEKDVIYENKIKNLQSQINTLDAKVDEMEKKAKKNSTNSKEKVVVVTPTERKKTTTKVVIKTAPKTVKNTQKKSDEDFEKIAETIAKGINKGIETAKKTGEFVKEVGKIIITPTEELNRQARASKVQTKNTPPNTSSTVKNTPKTASTKTGTLKTSSSKNKNTKKQK